MARWRTHTVDVEVSMDDFSDEELLEECRLRGLLLACPPVDEEGEVQRRNRLDEMIGDAMAWLIRKRLDKAEAIVADLIEAVVGHHLIAAYRAIMEGHGALAICHLDRHIDPPASVNETSLPIECRPNPDTSQEAG